MAKPDKKTLLKYALIGVDVSLRQRCRDLASPVAFSEKIGDDAVRLMKLRKGIKKALDKLEMQ